VARRLWLDRDTSFVLKRERYNAEGRLTSRTEYVEVEIGAAVPTDAFAIPRGWTTVRPGDGSEKLSLSQLSQRLGFPVRTPTYIPDGYALVGRYQREWGRWEVRMAELRYTDGLRVLSLYQRRREPDSEGRGWKHRLFGDKDRRHEGRGKGRGRGHGPSGGEKMTLKDHGTEKFLRYVGDELVVAVVGDLLADELVRIAQSVEGGGSE
jgi:negative regulator of sigma E activity